jgi:uncharacterized membrane protein
MKMIKTTLTFLNKQIVRIQWGYTKFIAFIGIINSVSFIVTALSVSNLVQFTWPMLIILFVFTTLLLLLLIYLMSKLGVLQRETRQTFDERSSALWKDQVDYQAIQIAYFLNNQDELVRRKRELEKKLRGIEK